MTGQPGVLARRLVVLVHQQDEDIVQTVPKAIIVRNLAKQTKEYVRNVHVQRLVFELVP